MARQGVCTGWLNSITEAIQQGKTVAKTSKIELEQDIAALSIDEERKVRLNISETAACI